MCLSINSAPGNSPCPPDPRPLILHVRPALALRFARLFPCAHIIVYHHNWHAIDDARQAAIALGLADRVHIHHISAAGPNPQPPARAA